MFSVEKDILHEYRKGSRWAQVYQLNSGHYLVRMFEEQVWQEDRVIKNKTERYAEDCAENYVEGIF